MSNVIGGTHITYFQMPQGFMTAERYKAFNKTQLTLYVYLWEQAQRYTTFTLKYAGKELAENTWMTETQVFAARDGLKELGLLQFEKKTVGSDKGKYEYSLTDPDTEECISDPRLQGKGFDFSKMTPKENEQYFVRRLKGAEIFPILHTGNGLKAVCPLCKGDRQTFEVNIADGRFWCHKCSKKGKHTHFEQLLALAQGLTISSKEAHKRVAEVLRHIGVSDVTTGEPEAVYSYADRDGEILFEVCRFPDKRFRRRKFNRAGDPVYKKTADLPNVIYRAPEVQENHTVCILEGEKDADSVHKLGIMDASAYPVVGSTNSGGANKWKPEHTAALKGKRVICIGDNDPRGERHMDDVQEALTGIALDVVRVKVPLPYKDVSDYLANNNVHDFRKLLPQEWIEEIIQI